MTVLQRTDLTISQKIECAAAVVARQHEHGSKTAMSEAYVVSRPTVYAAAATAQSVLRTHLETPLLAGSGVRAGRSCRLVWARACRGRLALPCVFSTTTRTVPWSLPPARRILSVWIGFISF